MYATSTNWICSRKRSNNKLDSTNEQILAFKTD